MCPSVGGGGGGGGPVKYERYVSMKKLLAVSIEMAKRGGAEVKRIRQQARKKERARNRLIHATKQSNPLNGSPDSNGSLRLMVQVLANLTPTYSANLVKYSG